jgi:hypothetical protein
MVTDKLTRFRRQRLVKLRSVDGILQKGNAMVNPKILSPDKSYTFRSYFKLRFSIVDILAELGASFCKAAIGLPEPSWVATERVQALQQRVRATAARVNLSSEAARREALVFPVLFEVSELTEAQMEIEYPVEVNQYLRGELDYYLRTTHHAVVVEAKQADLTHGFTQLAAELIALDRWIDSTDPVLYGAVTTGDIWLFGSYDRVRKVVTQDIELYRVPSDLDGLLKQLVAMLI